MIGEKPLLKETWNIALDIIYPRRCPICGEILVPRNIRVHKECKELLRYIKEPKCKKCGKLIDKEELEFCYDCVKKKFHYVKGYSLWVYDKRMQDSIAAFKYKNKKEYAVFYVEELLENYSEAIEKITPDVLIPIPLHSGKRRQRGFNQAEIIAKGIGKVLEIPVLSDLLVRKKETAPQKGLNDRERAKNLVKAFCVSNTYEKKQLHINKVILVDDIYTTGSTIEACTKVLLAYGVKEVYYISLCIGRGY